MKKLFTVLTLLAALFWLPRVAQAQETLTVADGTETSSYVPIYGFYVDAFLRADFIYPAAELVELASSNITQMTFYADQEEIDWGATFSVSLAEVTDVTLDDFYSGTNLTQVWSGMATVANNEMTITFSTPFSYDGGNLLVSFQTVDVGAYISSYWLGVSSMGSSMQGYSYTSLDAISPNQRNFLPKCTFEYMPVGNVCARVKNLTAETTYESITISWNDTTNSGATYDVQLITPGETADTQIVATGISGNTYTVTGLTANTLYTLRVKSNCADETASGWAGVTARTNCDPITLPYFDGFEDYDASTFPTCWKLLKGYSSYPRVSQGGGPEGNKYMYLRGYVRTDTNFFRSDLIPINANQMHISFWAAATNLTVGYMTSPNDASTFVPLQTISNNLVWNQYDIYTDTLGDNTNGVYLAFLMTGRSEMEGGLDAVKVEETSDCRRPQRADFSDITYQSARINWVPQGIATTWDVVIDSSYIDPDTVDVTYAGVAEQYKDLTDLEAYHVYYAWVRGVCGDGVTTDWTYLGGFRTHRTCYDVENLHVENANFSSAYVSWTYVGEGRGLEETGVHLVLKNSAGEVINEWDQAKSAGNGVFITGLESASSYTLSVRTFCDPDSAEAITVSVQTNSCGTVEGEEEINYLPFNANYNYGCSEALYPVSALQGMTEVTGLSWYINSPSTSVTTRTIDVYVGFTNVNVLTPESQIPVSSLTQVVSNGQLSTGQAGWTTISFATPFNVAEPAGQNLVVAVVNKTGEYSIVYWRGHEGVGIYGYQDPVLSDYSIISNYSSYNSVTLVPDIRFEGECVTDCPAPNLAVSAVEGTTVSLAWVAGGSESMWSVQYRPLSSDTWTDLDPTSETTLTIEGLAPKTGYAFRIGYDCGEGTAWSNIAVGYTPCADLEALPLTEDFESDATGTDPMCWTLYDYSSETYYSSHGVVTNEKHGGEQSMNLYPYITGDVQYLVSKALPEGTDLSSLEVSFWAKVAINGRLEVGFMTNPDDTASFETLATIRTASTAWNEYTYYTDNIATTGDAHLAFRWFASSQNAYLDDISVQAITCRRPVNLRSAGVSHESITMAWESDAAGFQLCITTVDSIPDSVLQEAVSVEGTEYTFDELEASTAYYVWVRSVCGDETTPWVMSAVRTTCEPLTMPWVEPFSQLATSLGNCWSRYTGNWSNEPVLMTPATDYWMTINPSITSWESGKALQGYSLDEPTWAVSPSITIDREVVMLSFDIAAFMMTKTPDYSGVYYSYTAPQFIGSDCFRVAISGDGGATWTPVYTLGNVDGADAGIATLTTTPSQVQLMLNGYEGQDIRIAFVLSSYAIQSYGYYGDVVEGLAVMIDNLSMQPVDCMHPINVVATAVADSVSIEWEDISAENESGYELILSTNNSRTSGVVLTQTIPVTDSAITITGLQPTTLYYYFLRSTCDENPTDGSYATGSFRTGCVDVVLPFFDNFSSSLSGNAPDCWNVLNAVTYSGYTYPAVDMLGGSYGNIMVMLHRGTTAATAVATPRIPAPLNNLEIEFDGYFYGPTAIYAATDLTDTNTWTLIVADDFNMYDLTTIELTTDTVPGLSADTGYFVFTLAGGSYDNESELYLDNVRIAQINPCRRPNVITVGDTTAYSAELSWTDISGASGYRVKYSTSDDAETADSVDVNSASINLTGLQNGATYHVWVYTLCGDGISEARTTSFTLPTTCYPISNLRREASNKTSIIYTWDIDTAGHDVASVFYTLTDLTDGTVSSEATQDMNYHIFSGFTVGHTYQIEIRTDCTADTSLATVITFGAGGGSDVCAEKDDQESTSSYVPMYGYYNYSYAQSLYPAQMLQGVNSISAIAYNVNATFDQTQVFDVYLANVADEALTTSFIPGSELTLVASDVTLQISEEGWMEIPFNTNFTRDPSKNLVVAVYRKTGTYSSGYGSFFGSNISGGNSVYIYRDGSPYDVNESYSGAVVPWVPDIRFFGDCGSGEESACDVPAVIVTDIDSMSAVVRWVGNSDSYTVQYKVTSDTVWSTAEGTTSPVTISLNGGTYYDVRVVGTCEGSEYISRTKSIVTDCYYEHIPFHVDSAYIAALSANGFAPCWDAYSFSASNSGRFSSSSSYGTLTLPAIAEPLTGAQVRIIAAGTGSIGIGVRNSSGDVSSIGIFDLPGGSNTDVEEYVVYLDSYAGDGNRIIISNGTYNNIYIYEVHVEPIEDCRMVGNLSVSNITSSSATVSWTPAAGQTEWLVYVDGQLQGTATSSNYPLTGLNDGTTYNVEVRTLCGAGDTARVVATSFVTPLVPADLPYTTGFEPDDNNGWVTNNQTNGWYIGSATSNDGSRALYISNDGGTTNGYTISTTSNSYAYKLFNLRADECTVSFDWKSGGESTYDYMRAFVAPASAEFSGQISTSEIPDGWYALDEGSQLNLQSDWQTIEQTIDIEADGQYYVVFFWRNDGSAGTQPGAAIDNFSISQPEPPCDAPVISTVSSTDNSITMQWTGTAQGYEVACIEGTTWSAPATGLATTATSYTFNALNSSTTYTVGVRAVCGSQTTEWVTRQVTTSTPADPNCNVPTNLNAGSITATSATITWTAGGSETAWVLEVSAGSSTNEYQISGTPSKVLTGLTANTSYTVRVKAVCSENSQSEWSASELFQTTSSISDVLGESFKLYPNPATVSVTVELDEAGVVSILDAAGRESGKWNAESGHLTVDLSGYAAGAYYVRVVTAQGTAVRKLVVR